MHKQLLLSQSYPSLGARIIHAYLKSYPAFEEIPGDDDSLSKHQMHQFLHEAISICYQNPECTGIPFLPDQCFEERWHLNKTNPELMDAMMKAEKKLFDWLAPLHKLGIAGLPMDNHLFIAKSSWMVTAKLLDKYNQLGLTYESVPQGMIIRCSKFPNLFPAWKHRSEAASAPGGQAIAILTRFLYGTTPDHPYRAAQMFGKLYTDSAWLIDLESFFEGMGYSLTNEERHNQVRWEKVHKDKERSYFYISLRWRDRNQMCFEFKVPAFRKLLGFYHQMEYALGELCYMRTKACDNCGYCTQTDKSRKRQKLALLLNYPGGVTLKCPLWPWFCWDALDEQTIAKVKKLFLFAEEKLYGNQYSM